MHPAPCQSMAFTTRTNYTSLTSPSNSAIGLFQNVPTVKNTASTAQDTPGHTNSWTKTLTYTNASTKDHNRPQPAPPNPSTSASRPP